MKLCLGTAQFGMNYGIQGADRESYDKIDEVIDLARDHGIHSFDSASAYGEAEDVLGHYIKHHPGAGDDMEIVSKLSPEAFKDVPVEQWREIAVASAKRDLDALHIPQLKAYLFHSAALIFDPNAVAALNGVRESGLAQMVGASVYHPEEAMKALEYDEIRMIQIPYNVLDRRLDRCGFFDRAAERGVLVFARSTLLQGLLMMDPEHLPDKMTFAAPYLRRFLSVCAQYDRTPLETAVSYVGQHKGIDHVVFGVDNPEQLKEYIAVAERGIPDEMVRDLDAAFEDVEERLVTPYLW